jgi:hypothetical protein
MTGTVPLPDPAEHKLRDLEGFVLEHGSGELDVAALLRLGGELLVVRTDVPAVNELAPDGFTGRPLEDRDGYARLVAVVDEGEPTRSRVPWGGPRVIWRAVTPLVWTLKAPTIPDRAVVYDAVLRPPLAYWLGSRVAAGSRFKLAEKGKAGLTVSLEVGGRVLEGSSLA